jgi:uncharacterized protein YggE
MSQMPPAETDPGPGATPTVSVVGEAVLRAEPDEALVLVSLTALKAHPGSALEDVAGRSRALASLLDELAIAPADRSSTGVSVHEDFDHTADGRRSLGHRAASAVAVRLTDLESIGRLVTRVTTELAARVDGPHWQIAAANPARLEAARQAAADGRRKAQAYAEGVGAQLGALIRLAEPGPDTAGGSPRGMFRAMAASAGGEMPIESGEQEITATIQVTFALVI